MKNSKILIFLPLLLILFLSIGAISASELNDTSLDNSMAVDDNVSLENFNNSENNSSNQSINSTIDNDTNESIFINYSPITKQYNREDIIYKVKVYSIVNFKEIKYNYPLDKIPVILRVYTGTSFKDYSNYSNYEGIASFKLNGLKVGTHNIQIFINNEMKGSSYIKINKPTFKVSAPQMITKYRKKSYFEVKVYYGDKPVNNLTLKLKFYTGKMYKINTITTKNGIAKLKLSNLELGTHKIVIQPANKKYNFIKYSQIYVKKSTPSTKLESLRYYKSGKDYYAKLTWYSKKHTKYLILRKLSGKFKVHSTVIANSSKTSFIEKVEKGRLYTYSVRKVTIRKGKKVYGAFDREGLKLIKAPKVSVDFKNFKANVSWSKVDGATKYYIYRKIGSEGTYKYIISVNATRLSYLDRYSKSKNDLSSLMVNPPYIDPSSNSLFYTVRGYWESSVCGVKKTSYGLYLTDGDFHLEAPSIVSIKNNTITWGNVPNAQGYLILKNDGINNRWEIIGQTNNNGNITQSINLDNINMNDYYAVQAYANKNGEMAYSNYDRGFSLKNFSLNNSKYKILYIGDSITYGAPYYDDEKHIFSIPYRVAELLGCVYYNPSIPGSTYHDLGQIDGINIENTDYYRYRICREVVDAIYNGELPGKWKSLDTDKNSEGIPNTKLEDYNIIVLSSGANDYNDNAELGDINSSDVSTFNGALNNILTKIEQASNNRIEKGEEPIKVIFTNFYSGISIKYTKPNEIGLTLDDYQIELDKMYEKWESQSDSLTFYKCDTRDYGIINKDNYSYATSYSAHFTKFTYGQYGNAFAQFLIDNIFEDTTV